MHQVCPPIRREGLRHFPAEHGRVCSGRMNKNWNSTQHFRGIVEIQVTKLALKELFVRWSHAKSAVYQPPSGPHHTYRGGSARSDARSGLRTRTESHGSGQLRPDHLAKHPTRSDKNKKMHERNPLGVSQREHIPNIPTLIPVIVDLETSLRTGSSSVDVSKSLQKGNCEA